MFRLLRIAVVALAASTALIAFVFSILATTSHEWAIRDYYNTTSTQNWTSVYFSISRSPFHICITTSDYENSVASDTASNISTSAFTTCLNYKPFGRNQTSCELRSVTLYDSIANVGDVRLCQQIHAAGNYSIASTVMICLGSMTVLLLSLVGLSVRNHGTTDRGESAHAASHTVSEGKTPNTVESVPSKKRGWNMRGSRRIVQGMHLFSTMFLVLGAILGLISQFYGILGLIQSAPNNADWASSSAGNPKNDDSVIEGYHGPWYQGTALGAYLTCAWAFALITPFLTMRLWSLPHLRDVA